MTGHGWWVAWGGCEHGWVGGGCVRVKLAPLTLPRSGSLSLVSPYSKVCARTRVCVCDPPAGLAGLPGRLPSCHLGSVHDSHTAKDRRGDHPPGPPKAEAAIVVRVGGLVW